MKCICYTAWMLLKNKKWLWTDETTFAGQQHKGVTPAGCCCRTYIQVCLMPKCTNAAARFPDLLPKSSGLLHLSWRLLSRWAWQAMPQMPRTKRKSAAFRAVRVRWTLGRIAAHWQWKSRWWRWHFARFKLGGLVHKPINCCWIFKDKLDLCKCSYYVGKKIV